MSCRKLHYNFEPTYSNLTYFLASSNPFAGSKISSTILFPFSDYKTQLYYLFGFLCLLSWLAFNLWALRDYFCPCWFETLYTESGLPKNELRLKIIQLKVHDRMRGAMSVPSNIFVQTEARKKLSAILDTEEEKRKKSSILEGTYDPSLHTENHLYPPSLYHVV
ncbi:unnamed protein product [Bursaphelenchus xylophilus]|uniref:(pine wood nematode) hypothetical protein n=1 Tax=Bursaphelenchus xylophilus TaxID=6326 RepID=A0A7I8XK63_BURXY|nr:unnamed protein product [Bursaphelenchus xylophilus]CAG9121543.1 unnamed protein product [Bursaphelenchus xylophilus]